MLPWRLAWGVLKVKCSKLFEQQALTNIAFLLFYGICICRAVTLVGMQNVLGSKTPCWNISQF